MEARNLGMKAREAALAGETSQPDDEMIPEDSRTVEDRTSKDVEKTRKDSAKSKKDSDDKESDSEEELDDTLDEVEEEEKRPISCPYCDKKESKWPFSVVENRTV